MRKSVKITLWIFAGLLILIMVLPVGLRLYFNDNRIKAMAEESISDAFGSKATIGELAIDDWLTLRLKNIEIKDSVSGERWFFLETAAARLRPWDLFSKIVHLESVEISGMDFDYGKMVIPETTQAAKKSDSETPLGLPFSIAIDSCRFDRIHVSGPEVDFTCDLQAGGINFKGPEDFSLSYIIDLHDGKIRYSDEELGLAGDFRFLMTGALNNTGSSPQNISLDVSNIVMRIPESYEIGDLSVSGLVTAQPSAGGASIDSISAVLNGNKIINFSGNIETRPELKLELIADKTHWEVASFADLANRLGFPVEPTGIMDLNEGRIIYKLAGIMYDFELRIADFGISFGDNLRIEKIDGRVYSDGDLDQIIFGSSLDVGALYLVSPDGSTLRLSGISSAVEAEISGSDYSLNITSGISDILGGRLDLSAFSENSNLTGNLKISDASLAQISAQAAGAPDTTVFGLLDLNIDIGGMLDSISTVLRADARNITIISHTDTLGLDDQDLEVKATTLVRNNNINSAIDYSIGPLLTGNSLLKYPIVPSERDSLEFSFDFDIDNSLLPSYFPSSLSASLGAIDISGQSALSGKFSSPSDNVAISGESKLTIHPTDLLVEDFQSLLFAVVSQSDVRVSNSGIDVAFQGGVGELYMEEYSDLPFSDIQFSGNIVSTSDTTWKLENTVAKIPSINTIMTAAGTFGLAGDQPFSDIQIHYKLDSPDPVALNSLISIQGEVSGEASLSQHDNLFEFSGEARINNLIANGEGIYCGPINGNIPYSGIINMEDSLFVKSKSQNLVERSLYRRNKRADRSFAEFGVIEIDQITFEDISASSIQSNILFDNGLLRIPYFTGEIIGGSFIGDVSCDMRDVNMLREFPNYENLGYSFAMETANLDFNQLVFGFGPFEKKAEFSSASHFEGRGIPLPGEDYSLEGALHVSKMGPDVLNRVLDFIDPEKQNPGVTQTKSLLNKKLLGFIDISYKPKEFSVEIKYGAIYPELYMSQPFYADFLPLMKIPMPIRYGRIPLATLMSGMEETR